MKLHLIATVARNRAIDIPWCLSPLLDGNIVVMGRKTYESLEVLPNSVNVVITSRRIKKDLITSEIEESFDLLYNLHLSFPEKIIYIIGGQRIFEYFINIVHKIHITYVDEAPPSKLFFPPFYNFELCLNEPLLTYHATPEYIVPSTINELLYLKLLQRLLLTEDTKYFGEHIRFNLHQCIPLITTREIKWPVSYTGNATYHFNIDKLKRLSCHVFVPIVDAYNEYPIILAYYAKKTYEEANQTNSQPYELIISTGETYIKPCNLNNAREQISRPPFISPFFDSTENLIGYFYHEKN